MKLFEILREIEFIAPLAYQENYDNSGLATGDREMDIEKVLLCVDVTIPVLDEAIALGANLIISHHPVIFSPLKQLTGANTAEKILIRAIRHQIAIYSAHTNLDNVISGVNQRICQKLGIQHTKVLVPAAGYLKKLVTFVPPDHADAVRTALFEAGAGNIGKYDSCSFNTTGKGTFKAGEGTSPYKGEIGKLHHEEEIRIETIFPSVYKNRIVHALLKVHPYEEVAYDIYPLDNTFDLAGSGMIGELDHETDAPAFLGLVKDTFSCPAVRHSKFLNKPVKRIAVCGGSGAFLIPLAISAGADMFITGEIKYHQFFDAEDQLIVADIGHYESEQFTIEIFYDILIKKLPNFAIHFSRIKTSPIYYI
jgi:dinuclear metal center YbgI/SA1388 family protein